MRIETLYAVAVALRDRNVPVTLEYPGVLVADVGSVRLVGGDANETFDIDVLDRKGDLVENIESTIPSDSTDVKAIADHFAVIHAQAEEIETANAESSDLDQLAR